jgi:hypothetical protein
LFEERFAAGESSRQQQVQNSAFVRCEFASLHATERYALSTPVFGEPFQNVSRGCRLRAGRLEAENSSPGDLLEGAS